MKADEDIESVIKSRRDRAQNTVDEINLETGHMRKIRFVLRRKLDGKIEAYNEILELLKNSSL